jgi:predicted ArsR family transcriptional regulator
VATGPKGSGRPEKLYRLTPKADALVACAGPALTLDLLTTAERVYGETAPPKLLYTYFQAKAEVLAPKLAKAATVAERAKLLAKLRTADGCLSACETDAHGHLVMVEHHRPLRELAARYDIVDELECEMIERLLGCEVRRSVEEVSGLVRVTFKSRLENDIRERRQDIGMDPKGGSRWRATACWLRRQFGFAQTGLAAGSEFIPSRRAARPSQTATWCRI